MQQSNPAATRMAAAELGLSDRWGEVFFSEGTKLLTVLTREPLPAEQIRFGLQSYLAADSVGELIREVEKEEEKFKRFKAEQRGGRNDPSDKPDQ